MNIRNFFSKKKKIGVAKEKSEKEKTLSVIKGWSYFIGGFSTLTCIYGLYTKTNFFIYFGFFFMINSFF